MRVLILEDDPLIALDLQLILESSGHEVIEICGSVSAADRKLGNNFDYALLDIDLPDGKSYGLASRLNERRIPFAFVSASKEAEVPPDLQHARFIAKPYTAAVIVNTLEAA